ncbi:MAG: polysaccharide deacetylase family protein [Lentisphaerae bacterium]|jgi:hypothetical protein|nr:polysaccharide deacetylase family protein [Lentisphaerota bacterium]MBT4821792.1 polysaccharide deacetylase family protein [Lentisphaerota bacterium]MBT5609262.1 polysaccharide deacetylase family protein [Lentisphaerota bacterium]MBT7059444.1 polysaccharide deacetylase family protein [Lentisphaerota bacterium]MBT7847828.1 polysaccharide deacetylase family protein [Lentisphaerota bacterium]
MVKRHHQIAWATAIAATAALLPPLYAEADPDPAPGITVVFRYDDYSAASQRDIDERVIELFRKHDCSFTVGAVPFIVSDLYPVAEGGTPPDESGERQLAAEKFGLLLNAAKEGVAEIAQHGSTHANRLAGQDAPASEFTGLSPQAQFAAIGRGKRHLEELFGQPVYTFIPPFNTYDQSTIAALDQLGFLVLSGDSSGPVAPTRDLGFAPQSCALPELKETVTDLQSRPGNAFVLTIFHPQDLREAETMPNPYGLGKFTSLPEVDALLGWLKQQPNVTITTIAAAVAAESEAGYDRMAAWCAYRDSPWRWALPPALQPHVRHYPDHAGSRHLWRRAVGTLCLYVLTIAFVMAGTVWGLGRFTGNVLVGRAYIGVLSLLGSLGAVAALTVKLSPIGYKDITLIAALPGVAVGLLLCARPRKPRAKNSSALGEEAEEKGVEPKAEAPRPKEPKVEGPKVEEPKVEEPKVDEPKAPIPLEP